MNENPFRKFDYRSLALKGSFSESLDSSAKLLDHLERNKLTSPEVENLIKNEADLINEAFQILKSVLEYQKDSKKTSSFGQIPNTSRSNASMKPFTRSKVIGKVMKKPLLSSSKENCRPFSNLHPSADKQDKEREEFSPKCDILTCIIPKDRLNTRFEDIVGADDAKKALEESILFPSFLPSFFPSKPWKGILLFGPPGTGKTLLASAACKEFNFTFFNISASLICNKFRGESEKMIKELFDLARLKSPSIIFFDEIDSIFSSRHAEGEHEASRRMKSELLVQFDGISSNVNLSGKCLTGQVQERRCENMKKQVLVLAATNFPWDLDEALVRRLEKRIYLTLPNMEARQMLFVKNCQDLIISSEVEFFKLAALTENYSAADISVICRDAALMPLRRIVQQCDRELSTGAPSCRDRLEFIKATVERKTEQQTIRMQDFLDSLNKTKPSVKKQDLVKYERWMQEFGAK